MAEILVYGAVTSPVFARRYLLFHLKVNLFTTNCARGFTGLKSSLYVNNKLPPSQISFVCSQRT